VFDCTGLKPVALPALFDGPHDQQQEVEEEQQHHLPFTARPTPLPVTVHQQVRWCGRVLSTVFAVGDCCAPPVPSSKLAYTAELQAVLTAHNIAIASQCTPHSSSPPPLLSFPESLSRVLPAPSLVCCSLGPYDGVLCFNDIAVTGWPAAAMKWLIEVSKVRQYQGSRAAEGLWTIAEPSVFAVNRVYQAAKMRWSRLTAAEPRVHR
jgi:hypothetical protein